MREIKFRAWREEKPKDMHYFTLGFAERYSDGYEVMQYTGLKDKNGKDIYEGDIMKMWDGIYGKEKFTKVKWNSKIAKFEGCWAEEIVGNIFENPELLTP